MKMIRNALSKISLALLQYFYRNLNFYSLTVAKTIKLSKQSVLQIHLKQHTEFLVIRGQAPVSEGGDRF